MGDHGISVAKAIEALRSELESALAAGGDRPVQFGLGDITLTMSVTVGETLEANGKLRWWLVEAGAGAASSSSSTQTLVLTLRPQLIGADGTLSALHVAAEDVESHSTGIDAEGDPAPDDPSGSR